MRGGNCPWPESPGAFVCWPELCHRRALDRGGDLACSRNCTRRFRASLAKSGRRFFCNRWVSRSSRSSVLHWKELQSPLVALARAFLPIVSTSIKPLQTGSLIDRTAPQYGGQMETTTASPPSATNISETERLAYSIQESADLLGVDYFSIYRLIQRGKLRACRALRGKLLVPRTELLRLLKN